MSKNEALAIVRKELERATKKFKSFHSKHEGYAIILEEMDELWDEIKKKRQNQKNIKMEAKQVAAMAIRFLMDTCK